MKKKIIDISKRPKCSHPGCNNPGQHTGNYRKDGTPLFRKQCQKHHGIRYEIDLQTLCANCHTFKTLMNKDYSSPGRKYYKTA